MVAPLALRDVEAPLALRDVEAPLALRDVEAPLALRDVEAPSPTAKTRDEVAYHSLALSRGADYSSEF